VTGYAVTLGQGTLVRELPDPNSKVIDALPNTKPVYVNGQEYEGGTIWHVVQYDNKWGYIRYDMLHMMTPAEQEEYIHSLTTAEQDPRFEDGTTGDSPIYTVPPYEPETLSCYGTINGNNVNFRRTPGGDVIRKLNQNTLVTVLESEQSGSNIWYRVLYGNQTGYIRQDYLKIMTIEQANAYFASPQYQANDASNRTGTNQSGSSSGGSVTTTGSPSGIASAEDQQISIWQNPNSGVENNYENGSSNFEPFATPGPINNESLVNHEYLDALIEQVQSGRLEADPEVLELELERFYKDSSEKDAAVEEGMKYLQEKLGLPDASDMPGNSQEETDQPGTTDNGQLNRSSTKEEVSGGNPTGWIVGGILIAGAAGGGYIYFAGRKKRQQAAKRLAQKNNSQARGRNGGNSGAARPSQSPVSAQQAARIRTGTYTGRNGTAVPVPPNTPADAAQKPYTRTAENPYGRYVSGGEQGDPAHEAYRTGEDLPGNGKAPERRRSNRGTGQNT
jgi:uncharacterized protein YgiM (DUF1202 family)